MTDLFSRKIISYHSKLISKCFQNFTYNIIPCFISMMSEVIFWWMLNKHKETVLHNYIHFHCLHMKFACKRHVNAPNLHRWLKYSLRMHYTGMVFYSWPHSRSSRIPPGTLLGSSIPFVSKAALTYFDHSFFILCTVIWHYCGQTHLVLYVFIGIYCSL